MILRGMLLTAAVIFGETLVVQAAEPAPRVLIIGIDGCRPDALAAARTPHLDALIAAGTLFDGTDIRKPDATDAADTISGPGWSNLLTGVWPDKHGVLDNKFTAPHYDRYPHVFSRLKEARPQAVTASFSTWAPITEKIVSQADVSREFSDSTKEYNRFDAAAAEACATYLREQNPDLVILYQGQVDEAGHAHGFHPSVPQYITAIEAVDANIGAVLAARQERAAAANENWLTIVCTDHGGQGTGHGKGHQEPNIRRTFLIVSGSACQQGKSDAPTWQVDVVATALAHLGVTPRSEWELDGQPVGLKAPAK